LKYLSLSFFGLRRLLRSRMVPRFKIPRNSSNRPWIQKFFKIRLTGVVYSKNRFKRPAP